MFKHHRTGRQARNFTTNVPKILDLKSFFEQIFSEIDVGCPCGVCMYLRNNINYQICDDLCDGQLECVVIEIIRPHSRPFFVSTWYKPPNSAQDVFRQFESLVDKVDSELKDFYRLGDLNCNICLTDQIIITHPL